jgi:hypothetical protein
MIPQRMAQVQGITLFHEIMFCHTPTHEGFNMPIKDTMGITITEELLMRVGFDRPFVPPIYEKASAAMDKRFRIHKVDDGSFLLGNYESLSSPLKYFHHLQNLYFDLMGEELPLPQTLELSQK